LDELRRAAARHGFWSDLAALLDGERRADPGRYVALSRELAALREQRLGDPLAALAAPGGAAGGAPGDGPLPRAAPAGAGRAGTPEAWRTVLDIIAAAMDRRPEVRVELHDARADIFEERLGDAKAALDERLAAFALAPDEGARDAIVRLAARTRRWEEVVR